MYKTDLDKQLLKHNISPWGESQQNSWRLYNLNKDKPGYHKHGNVWKHFAKHGVTKERLTDWDIPKVVGISSTLGLQDQLPESRPSLNYIRELNIYSDHAPHDITVTNDLIVKQTQDYTLHRDVYNSLQGFLEPLGWEKARYSRFQQYPNEMTRVHVDIHRQMSNMHNSLTDPILCGEVRIGVVFLNDWAYGQGFGMGKDIVQNWKMGDFYEWPWFFPHHTFNNSNVLRNSLTIIARKRS